MHERKVSSSMPPCLRVGHAWGSCPDNVRPCAHHPAMRPSPVPVMSWATVVTTPLSPSPPLPICPFPSPPHRNGWASRTVPRCLGAAAGAGSLFWPPPLSCGRWCCATAPRSCTLQTSVSGEKGPVELPLGGGRRGERLSSRGLKVRVAHGGRRPYGEVTGSPCVPAPSFPPL